MTVHCYQTAAMLYPAQDSKTFYAGSFRVGADVHVKVSPFSKVKITYSLHLKCRFRMPVKDPEPRLFGFKAVY